VTRKKAYAELARITLEKCQKCPVSGAEVQYRCCDKIFCEVVRETMPSGVSYPYNEGHRVPYMGPTGCVVSPEHRPYCSAYVCNSHLKRDGAFRAKYKSLCEKAGLDGVRLPRTR
jgi:hypothetical protein